MQKTQNLEQQLAELQSQIEMKRKELEEQHKQKIEAGDISKLEHPKETISGIIKEKMEEAKEVQGLPQPLPPPVPPKPPLVSAPDPIAGLRPMKSFTETKPSYESPELAPQLKPFEDLVMSKGLDNAMREIMLAHRQDPAIVDAFHDWLVEKAFNILIEKKELEIVT